MNITEEVRKYIHDWIESGGGDDLDEDAAAQTIIDRHPDIEGKDKDWYRGAAWLRARDEIHRQVPKTDNEQEPSEPAQAKFVVEGFIYVRKAYCIERMKEVHLKLQDLTPSERQMQAKLPMKDPEHYIVKRSFMCLTRIEAMTDPEIEAKENEYRLMATGCTAHANELSRYRKGRKRAA